MPSPVVLVAFNSTGSGGQRVRHRRRLHDQLCGVAHGEGHRGRRDRHSVHCRGGRRRHCTGLDQHARADDVAASIDLNTKVIVMGNTTGAAMATTVPTPRIVRHRFLRIHDSTPRPGDN